MFSLPWWVFPKCYQVISKLKYRRRKIRTNPYLVLLFFKMGPTLLGKLGSEVVSGISENAPQSLHEF